MPDATTERDALLLDAIRSIRRRVMVEHRQELEPSYLAGRLTRAARYQDERNGTLANDLDAGAELINALVKMAADLLVGHAAAEADALRLERQMEVIVELAPAAARAAAAEIAMEDVRDALATGAATDPHAQVAAVRRALEGAEAPSA